MKCKTDAKMNLLSYVLVCFFGLGEQSGAVV